MKNKDQNEIALVKLGRLKSGGLSLSFIEHVEKEDGGIKNNEWTTKNNDVPHPDLLNALHELKEFLARCFGAYDINFIRESKSLDAKGKTAFKAVKKYLDNMFNESNKKITINGFSVSGQIEGEKDKRGVVLSGTMGQVNGTKSSINSPLIKFNQDVFKFEDQVKVIVDKIEDEVALYLFENKKAEPELDLKTDPEAKEEKADLKAA